MRPRRAARSSARAFTLVEVALSVALLGVLMVASFNAIAAAARARRVQADLRQGSAMCSALMAEIMGQRFSDPKGAAAPGGSNRSAFNDLTDYDGLVDSPPTTKDATALPDATGWRRTVAVRAVTLDTTTMATTPSASTSPTLRQITVTAFSPAGKAYTLVGFRSAWGTPDIPTPDAGLLSGVEVSLRVRNSTRSLIATVPILNPAAP